MCVFLPRLNVSSCLQEDLLIHGDSVYDIIDKQDHASIQSELMRGLQPENTSASILDNGNEKRIFLCRMNVSRNARRQMRFGDQKVTICLGGQIKGRLRRSVGGVPNAIGLSGTFLSSR